MNSVRFFFEISLTGMLASGFAAIVSSGYLDLPAVIVGALAILVRAGQILAGRVWTLPNSTVTVATIAYLIFFAIDYRWLSRDFLAATVHLIIYLAIVKLFTASTPRDYSYLYVVAFLEMIAGSILSANAAFFPALALFLLFAVATFSCAEIRKSASTAGRTVHAVPRTGWRLGWTSVFTTAGVLALAAALFFLLPRTASAAFQHLIPARYHITGFSNEVVLGRIGELKRRSTPVMHVRTLTGQGQMPAMKWRGARLSNFDGRRWYSSPEAGETLRPERGLIRLADNSQRWRQGRRLAYEVHLQMLASDLLFVAGTPEFLQIQAPYVIRTSSGALRTGASTGNGIRYGVSSFVEDPRVRASTPASLSTEARIENLILPPTDPRVIELARSFSSPRAIEDFLRSTFRYSLDLPATPPPDPIAYFLFERKEGHCEYFASAMAVMLRAKGIPSRVVTGFQGGLFNPISGWLLIRASDAHSWIEAWSDGAGWVTYDPTPPDPSATAAGLSDKLALWSDALSTFWQDWILDYTADQQLSLASKAEHTRFRFSADWIPQLRPLAVKAWPWVLLAAIVIWFARRWRFAPVRRRRLSEAARLYDRMLNVLKRRGVEKPPWLTAREFARQLPQAPWKETAQEITDAYYRLRFASDAGAASEMKSLLKKL